MSTLGFFGSYLGTQAKALHDGIVKTIVSFDPEGASEAQINEYKKQVDKLAEIAAKAMQRAEADEAKLAGLEAKFAQFRKAAQLLSDQVEAATGPDKATKERALEKILADAEGLKGERNQAREDARDSRGYADERAAQHKLAVEKWQQGKARLAAAVREQQRAREAAQRAEERKREEASAAGLGSGLDTMDVALSAMKANTAADRQKATAANLTADALAGSSAADKAAQAALAAALGGAADEAKPSAKSRLAALDD